MELDFFKLYLQSYMRDHGFSNQEIASDYVTSKAEAALNSFVNLTRHGYSHEGAKEVAIQDLMTGMGLSYREVISEILLNNFSSRLELKDMDFIEFWVDRFSGQITLFEGFEQENGIGLNEDLVENSKEVLVSRFDKYLVIHGL